MPTKCKKLKINKNNNVREDKHPKIKNQLKYIDPIFKKKYGKDIREICFEKINDDFSYGCYGGFKVIIMMKNGYINCTHLCKYIADKTGSKKPFGHWTTNNNAKALIKEVSSQCGIQHGDLMHIIAGGQITVIRGTYVHPDLVPHIASWASPKFAIKVSRIVNEFLAKEEKDKRERLLQKKNDKIDELIMRSKEQNKKINKLLEGNEELKLGNQELKLGNQELKSGNEELKSGNKKLLNKNKRMDSRIKILLSQNDELVDKNEEIIDKIDVIANNRVIGARNNKDNHTLVIVKNNDNPRDYKKGTVL